MGRMALIIVVGFLIILGLLLYNMHRSGAVATETAVAHYAKSTARLVASTGAHVAWRMLETTDTVYVVDAPLLKGTYSASMQTIAPDTVRITAVGKYASKESRVIATFWKTIKGVPDVKGTVSLASDTIDVTIKGTPGRYAIDGHNYDLNGNPVGTGDKPGIVAVSGYDSTQAAAYAGQITGVPQPIGKDTTVKSPTSYVDELIANADYRFTGDIPSGNFGTRDKPVIIYCEGDVKLSGNSVIYGIVVVKGNLVITGTVKFYGLMIAYNDQVSISVDAAGTADLYGGLIMAGPAHSTFSMTGTATFYYSSQAIDNLRKIQRLRLYALQSWYES